MSKILVDTNLLLDDPNILFKLSREYDTIVLSAVVLKELDKHKTNPDLSYSARAAIGAIKDFRNRYPAKVKFVAKDNDISSNDSLIIETALSEGATIATKDISMSIIAESKNVDVELHGNIANGIFNPYLNLKSTEINFNFDYKQSYFGEEYSEILSKLPLKQRQTADSWFFIFIESPSQTPLVVYANNPLTSKLERIDNTDTYRYIKNDVIRFKAKDQYQMCAIYALNNASNVLITGKWGSGKSLITSAYALVNNFGKKSFISRPPIGIDSRYDIGFLPGGTKEKLESWAMGFLSSLYFLFGNTKGQSKESKSFDYVRTEIFNRVFELIDSNSLQGLSLLDDYLLVDEAQLCTIDLMSMILSRATKASRILLTGDLGQSYSLKPSNSGLLKLLRVLPHKSMAYVELQTSYRSDLLELADKLQDKSF